MAVQELLGFIEPSNLNATTIVLATVAISGVAYLISTFFTWWRLRHIPGPFLNSITPLLLTYHCIKADVTKYTYTLHEKYGPLVRIQPNMVMFSDPDTFRYICSQKAGYTKGLWFEFTRWDLKRWSLTSLRDNETRKIRKAQVSPAFVGKGLVTIEQRVDRQVRSFLDLVERKYVSTPKALRPMEFAHRGQFFTLDVVTNVAFGEPFGFLKKDGDVECYLETQEQMLPAFGILGSLPWLVHVMHTWPVNRMMPGEGDKVGFGRLMKFASDAVQKRLKPAEPGAEFDLIRSFLDNGIEPEDAVQECITIIVAGSETTSVALRMTMLSLLSTPAAYRKVQAEIDAYYSGKGAENAPDKVISYSDAKSFVYLTGAIREAMRLWPPSAGLFSKLVPKGGDTIHGFYLPEGTEIGQSLYGIGRQESIWGPDPEIFRPERWLEASPEKLQEMTTASDLVFSSGKYLCLGKPVAMMEMSKFFVEVLRRYEIAIINPPQPVKFDDPVTWRTSDFYIRFTRREM